MQCCPLTCSSSNMFFIFIFIFIITRVSLWIRYIIGIRPNKLPPGPVPLPIIGNLHLLGNLPHRALYKLSQKYGPIMSIRLGNVETVILSSPEATKLVLANHDADVSSRPKGQITKYFSYGAKGMVAREYGSHWRALRKLCVMELLGAAKVEGSAHIRKEEIGLMIEEIKDCSINNEVVNVSDLVGRLIAKTTFRMLFGKKDYGGVEFMKIVQEASELAGTFNLGDYVPILASFDLPGLTKRIKTLSKAFDDMLETIIADHEQDTQSRIQGHAKMDFTDILLSIKSQNSNTTSDISQAIDNTSMKALLVDLIIGAADASTTSIEWVLSALIRHPRVMKKVQQELTEVVGNKTFVGETDLAKLCYLHMVIKETFRLYPTAPLLVPRESTKDIFVNGYNIPKKTQIMVNFWAFGRDSKVWSENWDEFLPERFLDKIVDVRGQDFELIPFGLGRRGCPGINLGLVNIGLVVSNLVHSFNLDLPNGTSPIDLDMSEKFGLSMPRAKPLLAIPSYRL